MATTLRNYAIDTQLSTTAADIVSEVPLSTRSVVSKLTFYNSGSSARTVTVYVVESAGTADTGNTLIVKAIPAGQTWRCGEIVNEVLEAGQKVQAKQDAGTDVNANCSGADVT